MFAFPTNKEINWDIRTQYKNLVNRAFIEQKDELSPLIILANSPTYGKIEEADKLKISEIHSKISVDKNKSKYLFYGWGTSLAILYTLRSVPGKQWGLRLALPFIAFGTPYYIAKFKYSTGLAIHQGAIRDINQKYDWRNDEQAVKIIKQSLGFNI
ncbi:hypothetical protein PPERSA_12002 [Pseudocohnilembus persalinus]|uniref:Uncharacterized protein n=1 Tax=Pseudocohnilembus persalinus TaxID=266149 RepID=A0A0V0QKF4_PSEPJ|nr:hypothetical protein PPERSA_12002 [Pseudocohnilembus persalinus]|eukprot:KRX02662.1 hypothetical protein PPERSA_12002 [Pseudocohnilembus persalinus]